MQLRLRRLVRWGHLRHFNEGRAFLSRKHASTTTYYDSQSGMHVSYSDDVRVHLVCYDHSMKGVDLSGIESITSPTFQDNPTVQATQYIQLNSKAVLESPSCHFAVDFVCSEQRENWNEALDFCAGARKTGSTQVKVCLVDAFAVDSMKLQLASSLLADAGVEILVLQASAGAIDTDDLDEAMEACLYNDIAGLPMKQRIGLRVGCGSGSSIETEELIEHALTELNVKHFDSCLDTGIAPLPTTFASILDRAGLDHPLRTK